MSKQITRRTFLKGSAIGAAAAMMPPIVLAQEEKKPEQEHWDMAADFVVVGGGTGLAGAIAGAVEGMSVILLEKRSAVGGAMALSGGVAWMPNTEYSNANGDNRELSEIYLKHMMQEYDYEEVMYAFLDNTQNAIDTLKKGGTLLQPLPYPVEYHADWEGACNGGGRSLVVYGENGEFTTVGGGARMNEAMIKSCNNLGVKIITNIGGEKLITTREGSDSVPKVIGLIATDDAGNEYRIKAHRGVLLATGGFEWDEKLTTHFVRVPIRYYVSYPTNNGAGLKMVQSVGAELSMMNEFWGMSVYTAHGEHGKKLGIPCPIACQTERAVPGSIMVDRTARRFCNEASDYDSQGNTMGGYYNTQENGWSADPAWLIYDDTCYTTYNVKGRGQDTGFATPDIPEDEMIVKADTLEELAQKLDLNPEQLVRTVEEFNQYAKDGKDPLFHRGETMKPLSRIKDTLAPLEKGPYRAISVSSGTLGTKGGPRLNKHAQVMHVYGEPIEGLYAMGNCSGVGGPGPAYGGGGGTIGPAFVMGVLAAQHAAARKDVEGGAFYTVEIKSESDIELAQNEYLGVGSGLGGPIKAKVTVEDGRMTKIEVVEHMETPGVGDRAFETMPAQMIEKQSADVDLVSGATISSKGLISAVRDALAQAGL